MCTELLLDVNEATTSLYSLRHRGAIPFTIRGTHCETASEIELRDPQSDENQTCPGRFAEKNTDKDVQSRVWYCSRRRFVGLLLLHLPLFVSIMSHYSHTHRADQVSQKEVLNSSSRAHCRCSAAAVIVANIFVMLERFRLCPVPMDDGFRCTSANVDNLRSFLC